MNCYSTMIVDNHSHESRVNKSEALRSVEDLDLPVTLSIERVLDKKKPSKAGQPDI